MKRTYVPYFILLLYCTLPGLALSAGAKVQKVTGPAHIKAQSLNYNNASRIATAVGDVEVTQEGRTLYADQVTYYAEEDRVIAEGNVKLVESTGDTFFSDRVELTDQMKRGVINSLSARFVDGSKMQASIGERLNEDVFKLEEASYTPCKECDDEGNAHAPVWRIRAKNVRLDEAEQTVTYKHARFELYDVPVLYTPYFSHPTPGADRKSGFLTPTYGTSSTLGTRVRLPYYWNIAQEADATIAPIFTTDEGPILTSQFRHATEHGRYELLGSLTNPYAVNEQGVREEGRDVRGHIEGWGQFNYDQGVEWGFEGKRSSDDTYLRRYEFGDEDDLTTRLYGQKLVRRNYIVAEALSFQGLHAEDDPDTTPLVLPLVSTHYEFPASESGARFFTDGNVMALTRNEGTESRRLSVTGGWATPFISDGGHVFETKTTLRGDIYSVENVVVDPSSEAYDGNTGRAIPQMEFDWSYPLIRRSEGYRITMQPVANAILSPYGGNPNKIPNEDSQNVEISDENLFSPNHFTGLDRVEGGPRVNYGLRTGFHTDSGYNLNTLFGQNYRTREDSNFSERTGMSDNFSDYVGRASFDIGSPFMIGYRFRLDEQDFQVNRHEIFSNINYDPIAISADYLMLDAEGVEPKREEISSAVGVRLSQLWQVRATGRRDLTDDGGWIDTGTDLIYTGDCVDYTLSWYRIFTRDRDVEPSTSVTFQVSLKNLH
ncbi:MAG: lptD [Rickettsiales bacterium]|jgi:LPS-assembly protein|nr:lptD [Rickettsiales bacterium]